MGTKRKQNYEQRMESIMNGREGRDKFGSKKSSETRGSTTNKEKSKKKSFVMMKHKRSVSGKAKRSLREQQVRFLYYELIFFSKFFDNILQNKRNRIRFNYRKACL